MYVYYAEKDVQFLFDDWWEFFTDWREKKASREWERLMLGGNRSPSGIDQNRWGKNSKSLWGILANLFEALYTMCAQHYYYDSSVSRPLAQWDKKWKKWRQKSRHIPPHTDPLTCVSCQNCSPYKR